MPLPPDYTITLRSNGYAVSHSYFGELEDGIECRARAEDLASDHAAALEERAELDAIYEAVNARGGYVSAGDANGLARGRAIDLVLSAIESLRSDLPAAGSSSLSEVA